MSTITVTNIKATGETASRAVSGVVAAWCDLDGTGTIALEDSFNCASATDNGTGDYTRSIQPQRWHNNCSDYLYYQWFLNGVVFLEW